MTFPLHAASQFYIHIKRAAGEPLVVGPESKVPAYAPPDTTGQLEGQFAAPIEQVIEATIQSIENELKTGYAYMAYSNQLRDMSHHSIAEEFESHASDEAEHADFLMRRLAVMAGARDLPPIPPPPTLTDPTEIVSTMLRMEQEGIAKWRVLRSLVGDEHPMRFKIEEYLTKELEHLDEVVQLLPPEMRLGGSQITEKAASTKKERKEKWEGTKASLRGALFGGLAGTAATGLHDGATGRKTRSLVGPGAAVGAAAGLIHHHLKKESGYAYDTPVQGSLRDGPPEERRRSATGTDLDHPRIALDYHTGRHRVHEGRVISEKDLADAMRKTEYLQVGGEAARNMGYGALAGATVGGALGHPHIGTGLGVAGGGLLAYLNHRKRKAQIEEEAALDAPMAPGASRDALRTEAEKWTPFHIIPHMAAIGVGEAALLAPTGANLKNPAAGVALLGGGIGGVTTNIAKLYQAANRDTLDMRAREREKKADLFLPKLAAEPMTQTAIPNSLSPSAGGALASIAAGEPGGTSPGLTGDDMGGAEGAPPPILPSTVSPEDIDPTLLMHLQTEQAGRREEEQGAANYMAQQAEASRQQAEQFQQQLQQKEMELQQMQGQLQQVQGQLQQTQGMAQQASDTATQSLQQQLQLQQMALQSRQQTTQVLQMSDGLRQQIRELVDPAPPPPAPNTDPTAQAGGQLPPGMDPQAIPGGQPTQPASGGAPPAQPPTKQASLPGDAFAAAGQVAQDLVTGDRSQAVTKVILPAGVALANAAWHLRPGAEERRGESVSRAQSSLSSAQRAYEQDGSFANAARLVAAKGALGAAELERDHPNAVAATRGLRDFAAVRATGSYATNIGTRVKRWAHQPHVVNNTPRPT